MFTQFVSTALHRPGTCLPALQGVRWFILLGSLLMTPVLSNATTYYVDSESGNDSKNGVTTSTPWKTIAKVNGRTFQPGDFILFRRGSVWREQLTVPSSGTAGKPITFGAYGTGAKPVISGTDIVGAGGWYLYSGKIYTTTVSGLTSSPNQLYMDGVFYDIAHYPNTGYLLATANSPNTRSIVDTNLDLTPDQVVGATFMVRAVPWRITATTGTAYDYATHTVTLNGPVYNANQVMRAGYGFYLLGMLWMLDSPTEWYCNPSDGRLYLWTAGGDIPSGHTVEVSNRSYGVLVSRRNYITIQDLAITRANRNNLHVSGANNIMVNNLDVSGGQVGIYFSGTFNSAIRNNSVQNTLADGIRVDWGVSNIDISNNAVNNAGNVGVSPKYASGSIYLDGISTTSNISNNIITNSGYIGIIFQGDGTTVRNNFIDRSCLVLDDCAAIYTGSRGTAKTIAGNTVTNSIGNLSGSVYKYTQAHGIYLDDFAQDTTVLNNIVSNVDNGIYIHTGHNNTITGNTIYWSRVNGLLINETSSGASPGAVHDNIVTDNTFETISTDATAKYYSTIESATDFGTYDRNKYCHPISDFVIKNQGVNYNLPAWRQASGQDLNSTDTKALCTAPPPTVTLKATPATVTSGGSTTLTWSSSNAISCTASGAWSGKKAVSSNLRIENLTSGGTYTLTCTGRGGTAAGSVTVAVSYASVPLSMNQIPKGR